MWQNCKRSIKKLHALFLRIEIRGAFSSFWDRNPALFLGLTLLLGNAAVFYPHWLLFTIFGSLCISASKKSFLVLALLCFCGAHFTATLRYPKQTLSQDSLLGKAIFHVKLVKIHSSPFHRSLLYHGTLKHFEARDGQILRDLPCNIYLPLYGKHPPANSDYEIFGRLSQKADYAFVFKVDKDCTWLALPTRFNLSEWRFQAKSRVARYLKNEIANPAARSFLTALATGEIDERILSMEFSKVGLQHILAISGFHFALAALFVNLILRLMLPYRAAAAMLIIFLTAYYLFLGNAPSIQRAYIAILLVSIGQLFSWRLSGLNALGCGMILELLCNPLVILQLGFQLTFLCTLAILLLYPVFYRVLAQFFVERSASQALSMSFLDRHGYLFTVFFRQSLALNFAVHVISLPVLLHTFHQFPLLSLVYNLFFPICVCLCMFLLFIGLLFAPLFPVASHWIHLLNNGWTSSILTLTSNPPAFLDFSIRTKEISFSFVLIFLTLSFFLGVFFYEAERNRKRNACT